MKARPRPSALSVLLICCTLCFVFSVALIPPSHAYGKTRTEVQLGDPTDTDPGPMPATTAKAARFEQVSTSGHGPLGLTRGYLLKFWLKLFLARYWFA